MVDRLTSRLLYTSELHPPTWCSTQATSNMRGGSKVEFYSRNEICKQLESKLEVISKKINLCTGHHIFFNACKKSFRKVISAVLVNKSMSHSSRFVQNIYSWHSQADCLKVTSKSCHPFIQHNFNTAVS